MWLIRLIPLSFGEEEEEGKDEGDEDEDATFTSTVWSYF